MFEFAALVCWMPMGGAYAKSDSGRRMTGKSECQCVQVLKHQTEITGAALEAQHLWRCDGLEIQHLSLFINKAQVINEGWAMQIAFDAGFNSDQAFCKFYI